METPLTAANVRTFMFDTADKNVLLDDEEFTDDYIALCMDLAVSAYNSVTPVSSVTLDAFPYKVILLYGTLWQMFQGRAALAARNQLSYSDGGLTIPIEERYELYTTMAASYGVQFQSMAQKQKIQDNIDNGWSSVGGDASFFGYWG